MATDGIHSCVGKVFIKSDDNSLALLCPFKNGCVGGASKSNVTNVPHAPLRPLELEEIGNGRRDVFVENDRQAQREMTCSSSTTLAAYSRAAFTSSRVRSGYAASTRSTVYPSANIPRMLR